MNVRGCFRPLIGVVALLGALAPIGGGAQPLAAASPSAIVISSISPDHASGQHVGTTITWTATATGGSALEYQFAVTQTGRPSLVVRDFEPTSSFTWTPIVEASYTVTVTVHDASAPSVDVSKTSSSYSITTRLTGQTAVVTPTKNALVFLYSAPPCAAGQTINASFGRGSRLTGATTTSNLTCDGVSSMNWYLGGMLPSTQYGVRYTVSGGTPSAITNFTTGVIPSSIVQPMLTVPVPATSSASVKNPMVVFAAAGYPTNGLQMLATNLNGKIMWYYDPANAASVGSGGYVSRPIAGQGTMLIVLNEGAGPNQPIREIDLAGNTLLETTTGRINEELGLRGNPDRIDAVHHEITRLPTGHTIVLGYVERLCPNPPGSPYTCPAAQGGTTAKPVDILGDMLIDLDQNFQVAWTWTNFDHLDINRAAILGETCADLQPGCPGTGLKLASIANDWTHTNATTYSPTDHNLLVSMRHQDWIIKVDYNDGTGTGNVLWHLGNQGDFTLFDATGTGGTFPWQSHQHGIEVSAGGIKILTFDNGNTRCSTAPPPCDSRGQQYTINESARTAVLSTNVDMGNYSQALGWGQTLRNGDFAWTSGAQGGPNPQSGFGQEEEFTPTGTQVYVIQKNNFTYRTYRMQSLYSY
jgi:hypothetical protein